MTTRSATLGILLLLAGVITGPTQTARAQGLALPDPVLETIWIEAMENSSFEP